MVAGTDSSRGAPGRASGGAGGPAIVLIDPQLGENIGAAARAMLNCELVDLRLVRPRDGWPNPRAVAAAVGADLVLDGTQVFEDTSAAVAGFHRLYATTARRRDMLKPVVTPRAAAVEIRAAEARGERVGILFGPERKGLHNDDVTLADKIIEAPLNPAFASLNLGQAVLLVAYEWRMAGIEAPAERIPPVERGRDPGVQPATREALVQLFEHLERELDDAGFLYPPEKRPAMVRSLRNLFLRAGLTDQEVRTLRGVIRDLSTKRGGGGR